MRRQENVDFWPSGDRDTSRNYHAMYRDETRELVTAWYQPEIKLLGYGF